MSWWPSSAITSALMCAGPLILAESAALRAGARSVDATARRRLRGATVAAWIVFAIWFWFDRAAIDAGQRPLHIIVASVMTFGILFTAFAMPMLRVPPAQPPMETVPIPSAESFRRAQYALLPSAVAMVLAFATTNNDIGYQIKSTVILGGGLGVYAMELGGLRTGRPIPSLLGPATVGRATAVLYVFATAAVLALVVDWDIGWQRWLGITAQWISAVVGFVQCAGILVQHPDSVRSS